MNVILLMANQSTRYGNQRLNLDEKFFWLFLCVCFLVLLVIEWNSDGRREEKILKLRGKKRKNKKAEGGSFYFRDRNISNAKSEWRTVKDG